MSVELQRIIDEFVSYQQSMADEQGMDAELIRSYTTGRTSTLMESSSKPKTISSYNAHVTEMREDDLDFEENDDGEDIEVFGILKKYFVIVLINVEQFSIICSKKLVLDFVKLKNVQGV